MNILDGTKYNFTYQSYNAIIIDFDIYNDSNYWDSNLQGLERELWFNLSIASTDFYSNDTLHCVYTYYDDFDLTILRNLFINQSDYRSYLDVLNMEKANSTYMYNGNGFILESNTLYQNYGSKFNFENSKDLVVYLWYENNDLYFDDMQVCYTNRNNTPFGNSISQTNYISGYNEGYQAGLDDNQQDIYSQGFSSGYSNGELNGYNNGFDEGKQLGISEGYENGLSQGYQNGYYYGDLNGYQRGLSVGENGDLSNMVITIADTPLNVFKTIFDVEFLGINLVPLFFGLATLGVVIWVVRRFMGGD